MTASLDDAGTHDVSRRRPFIDRASTAAPIVLLGEPVRAFHIVGGAALAGVACAAIFRRPLWGPAAVATVE
jgi:hypothetical protein